MDEVTAEAALRRMMASLQGTSLEPGSALYRVVELAQVVYLALQENERLRAEVEELRAQVRTTVRMAQLSEMTGRPVLGGGGYQQPPPPPFDDGQVPARPRDPSAMPLVSLLDTDEEE